MSTLEAEDVACRLARGRQLPAVLVGELPGRAGSVVGRRARHIPLADRCDGFREVQRDRPAAQRSGAGVGNADVHLEEATSGIGRRRSTAVCGKCLIAQQQAEQQHAQFDECFHCFPLLKIARIELTQTPLPATQWLHIPATANNGPIKA
jgi:hypothetical protein